MSIDEILNSELRETVTSMGRPPVLIADDVLAAARLRRADAVFVRWLEEGKSATTFTRRMEALGYGVYRNVYDRHKGRFFLRPGVRRLVYARSDLSTSEVEAAIDRLRDLRAGIDTSG